MQSSYNSIDTIVAIATPSGTGGVGVVRVSGRDLTRLCVGILGSEIASRKATYTHFRAADGECLDTGIALYFPGPASFTGESVLELQGHGGIVVLDRLVQRCIQLGARHARPGEFTERAFLHGKIDLTQAEAVADLIESSSVQAARSALRSMQGDFAQVVNTIIKKLIDTRVYVEAAIDFPEEEVDFLAEPVLIQWLDELARSINQVTADARQGVLLRDGLNVVLAGKPNVGKSSLLNRLLGEERAIVTDEAGTTRDVLKHRIVFEGVPIQFIDTAGLRDTDSAIEREGIRRAWLEIDTADHILLIADASEASRPHLHEAWPEYFTQYPEKTHRVSQVFNKIDCSGDAPGLQRDGCTVCVSAKYSLGIQELLSFLVAQAGYIERGEGIFSARRRHLLALADARVYVQAGRAQLDRYGSGELLAEDLRMAQKKLEEIGGAVTSDDLLGHIFSSFCIGK